MSTFIEQFKKEIEGFTPSKKPEARSRGVVVRVGDGVAELSGLEGAVMSEMVRFNTAHGKSLEQALGSASDIFGLVLNLEESAVRAVILGDTGKISEGMEVETTGEILSIPVGE
ncbi:MAG: hypothetical protein AAB964_01905, partial [Patescibacteria group bacterium]